jgi:hypothetical protein
MVFKSGFWIVAIALVAFMMGSAKADTSFMPYTSSRVLQEALTIHDSIGLYDGSHSNGLAFGSGIFSGRASGNTTLSTPNLNFNSNSTVLGDQNVYAVLLDGRYDFNHGATVTSGLHPYLSGGAGMAMYGSTYGSSASALQSGQMVPLARVGGGVAYHVSERLNLSLDYNAGFSGHNDQVVAGRSAQSLDMQAINMGMHFSF